MRRVKVAEFYLDGGSSYGLVRMMPHYRTLTHGNSIDILDTLVGLRDGIAAAYEAAIGGDAAKYAQTIAILAKPTWSDQDREFIDGLLASPASGAPS